MNPAARRTDDARAPSRIDPRLAWPAALLSVLLHVACLVLAWLSPPVTMSTPQGGGAGSPMYVEFVGVAPPAESAPEPTPRPDPAPAPPRAASRVQTTPVPVAEAARNERARPAPVATPSVSDTRGQATGRAAAATPPRVSRRPSHTWGQPPGMRAQDSAPDLVGTAPSQGPAPGRGRGSASAEPSLDVGGYQVYYDLRSERRLRAWQEQGMTELFIPLPGTRELMVCPLETALRRESGACRLLPPDAPELAAIGDARQVIDMHQVYRRGELVWRGPRPYR